MLAARYNRIVIAFTQRLRITATFLFPFQPSLEGGDKNTLFILICLDLPYLEFLSEKVQYRVQQRAVSPLYLLPLSISIHFQLILFLPNLYLLSFQTVLKQFWMAYHFICEVSECVLKNNLLKNNYISSYQHLTNKHHLTIRLSHCSEDFLDGLINVLQLVCSNKI